MRVVEPDFTRMIDLPGTGPCQRPVDIDQSVTGFAQLVSLRVYSFVEGMAVDGEAEDDDLFLVLMSGAIDVEVAGGTSARFSLSVGEAGRAGTGAIYLPPHDRYRLTALSDADVAYARARPRTDRRRDACGFDSVGGTVAAVDYADSLDIVLSAPSARDDRARDELIQRRAERLVHVRGQTTQPTVTDQPLRDWQTLALDADDAGVAGSEFAGVTSLIVAAALG